MIARHLSPVITAALVATVSTLGIDGASSLQALDLRVGYDVVGTGEHSSVNGASSDFSWDHANRYTVDALFSSDTPIIGLLAGVGLAYDDSSRNTQNHEFDEHAYFANVEGGVYLSVVPALVRLELVPFVGIGRSKVSTSYIGDSSAKAEEYGANLNLVLHIPVVPVVAGVGVGLLHTQSDQSLNSTRVDLHDSVAMVGAFVGLSF